MILFESSGAKTFFKETIDGKKSIGEQTVRRSNDMKAKARVSVVQEDRRHVDASSRFVGKYCSTEEA